MAHEHGRGRFLRRAGPVVLMGACAMLLSVSRAGAVVVDDFDTAFSPDTHGGLVLAVNGANLLDCSTQTGMATVLGGSRKAVLHYLGGTGSGSEAQAEDVTSPKDILTYSNGSDDTSELTLLYNGTGAGLGDLTGGPDQFVVNLFRADLNASITVIAFDGTNTASDKINVMHAVTSPMNLIFPFSDFTGVDFTDIQSLTLLLTSVNKTKAVDFEIDAFEIGEPGGGAPIPEPLTMLGMFLGLGGIGSYLRRWRRA